MNDYELLLDKVNTELPVLEVSIPKNYNKDGLYRNGRIYIEKNNSMKRKREILAEEYAHHKTSVGNIINLDNPLNSKQELYARKLSIEQLVSLDDLIECGFAGCSTKYECAEYLDITEEFLKEVIDHYHTKYGITCLYRGCILNFTGESIVMIDTGLN